jgi:hypothetical protein
MCVMYEFILICLYSIVIGLSPKKRVVRLTAPQTARRNGMFQLATVIR